MKFRTAVAILSTAGGALATMHEAPQPQNMYQSPPMAPPAPAMEPPMEPPMVHNTAPALANTAPTMVHQAPAAAGATHMVHVGGAGLEYNPPQVQAAVGDVVHFVFLAKNHTVTQSTFAEPCKKMEGGMDSGFMPNEANTTQSAPTFQVTVTAMEPTWWYCRQKQPKNHCTSGMVFAINPTAEKSFEAFLQTAKGGAQEGGAAVPPPPPPANTLTLSVDNGGVPPPAATPPPALAPPPPAGGMVAGWNAGANPAACNCACFCGVTSFPSGSGIGAYGGFSGAMPAAW